MRNRGRLILLLLPTLWLAGCAAMMIGGNNGGYQPPMDQCEDADPRCEPRQPGT